MPQSPIATAADYADAMLVARRAKNVMFLLLLLMILAQLGIFFAVRFQPHLIAPEHAAETGNRAFWFLRYVIGAIDFLGIVLTILLGLVLLLITNIMLVGRLIGVSKVTAAYIGCVLLALLLFPWQAFLSNGALRPAMATPTVAPSAVVTVTETASTQPSAQPAPPQADFKVPGALYTWTELVHPVYGARFGQTEAVPMEVSVLRWSRYVAFPVIALFVLLAVQIKSSRGLRLALGEADLDSQVEAHTP